MRHDGEERMKPVLYGECNAAFMSEATGVLAMLMFLPLTGAQTSSKLQHLYAPVDRSYRRTQDRSLAGTATAGHISNIV